MSLNSSHHIGQEAMESFHITKSLFEGYQNSHLRITDQVKRLRARERPEDASGAVMRPCNTVSHSVVYMYLWSSFWVYLFCHDISSPDTL